MKNFIKKVFEKINLIFLGILFIAFNSLSTFRCVKAIVPSISNPILFFIIIFLSKHLIIAHILNFFLSVNVFAHIF